MAEDRSDIHSRYRPEIDGLRSVAVMSVLLYHAGFNFCSGGFVGVDVFFVISGFLITGILLDDLDAGIFSLKNFYERRLRRILPPLFAMSVVVAALAWLYLLPFDFKNYGRSLAAMAAFWANIFFWKQSGYFDAASFAKPLLHTWSLSVEEQFYILFPFFLRFFYRWVKARLPLFLLMSFFLSLMVSAVQVEYQPDMAFYWLHSRAWELLAGSLTAVWSRHPDHPALRLTGRFPSAFAFLGLAAMLGPICLYEETTSFPGLAALPPTLGTALIILAHHGGASSSPAGRILASAPFTGLGKISYSLYLWHWPLLAMPRYAADAPLSAGQAAAALAAAFIPAWLSWRFVENPVRRREVFRSRRAVFIAAGVGLVVLAAAGRIVRTADGFPGRLPPAARLYAAAAEDSYRSAPAAPYFDGSVDGVGYTVKAWPVGPQGGPPFFLLWGDSHARMWRAAFDRLAEENQVGGLALDPSGCWPLFEDGAEAGGGWNCNGFRRAVMELIRKNKVKNVVIAIRYTHIFGRPVLDDGKRPDGGPATAARRRELEGFARRLQDTFEAIAAAGAEVWFVESVPEFETNVVNMLSRAALKGRSAAEMGYGRIYYENRNSEAAEMLDGLAGGPVRILKVGGIICPDGWCAPGDAGSSFYLDDNHLTNYAAELFRPVFAPLFQRACERKEDSLTQP